MTARLPILVAGAGIAGLTVALSLARRGFPVTVLERTDVLHEVGAGIQIAPNASRILIELGLGEAVAEVACRPRSVTLRSGPSGQDLARIPLGAAAERRYGAPHYVIHRGALQALLARAAVAAGVEIRLGCAVGRVLERDDAVHLRLADDQEELTGSAVIGADGVWSRIRRAAMGGRAPDASGRIAWRAVVPAEQVPEQLTHDIGLWFGPHAHLVHYPIASGRLVNLVAVVTDAWHEETWSGVGDPASLFARFGTFVPMVRDLLTSATDWLRWPLMTVDPLSAAWNRGRIALIGDAAHAMLPFAAQGGGAAIEDAAVLADQMATQPDTAAAFSAYVHQRRPRVHRIWRLAEDNVRIFHMHGLMAFARDSVLKMSSSEALMSRQDWLYGWQRDTVPA